MYIESDRSVWHDIVRLPAIFWIRVMHGCFHDEGGHGPIPQLLPIVEPVAAVWKERRGRTWND